MCAQRFVVTMDGVEAYMIEDEKNVLIDIAIDLRAILETPALTNEDPVRERLFPRAYLDPTEETAEMTWAAFAHPELLESRVNTLMLMVNSLKRLEPAPMDRNAGVDTLMVLLSPEETESWLKGINDLRLALGTRLDITEDDTDIDPADPSAALKEIYHWLTDLQEELLAQVYLS